MTYKITDMETGEVRDATPGEVAQFEADKAEALALKVPQVIDMYQAHLALIDRGHMARVREVLDAMPGVAGEKARAYFDQSPTMKRKHPLVLQLMPIIPLTDTQVDELFIHAHTNF